MKRTVPGTHARRPGRWRIAVTLAAGLTAALAAAAGGCDTVPARQAAIGSRLQAIFERPVFKTSTFGIRVVRLRDGRVLYEKGADKLLPAASCVKLVSGAGAFLALGPDYRFRTRVVATGPIKDGVLHGNLVLVASGDPNLSQRVSPGDRLLLRNRDHSYAGFSNAQLVNGNPLQVVRALAREVARRGVRRIDGHVVVDDGLFRETEDSFVGPFSAACVNDNLVDVVLKPGDSAGDPVSFKVEPSSPVLRVTSEARTVERGGAPAVWVEPVRASTGEPAVAGGPAPAAAFVLRGTVPLDSGPLLRVAPLEEPARVVAALLAAELREEGIRVEGEARRSREGPGAYTDSEVLATHTSAPFSQALRVMLKVSQNLHATMLPPLLGALRGSNGDRRHGYAVIRDTFLSQGLDMDSAVLESGSGGGRADLVTARWMTRLLSLMASRDDFPIFLDTLPIAGVDGTLASAFRASRLRGRVRAKTGTLVYPAADGRSWVYRAKSLCGYLDAGGAGRREDLLVFAILIANTYCANRTAGAQQLLRAQQDILETIADLPPRH